MIEVTRLDGSVFYLNPHEIESIEARPDVSVTLVSGKRYVLRDTLETLQQRIVTYRRQLTDLSLVREAVADAIGALHARKNADKLDN
ncbi:MAG: flagellar FlbD family protein [Spirochaetales bacterium]